MAVSEYSERFFKVLDQAACHSMPNEMFYPEHNQRKLEKEAISLARAVCLKCPIYQECYDHSIRHEEFGLWAGMSPHQRRAIRTAEKIEFISFTLAVDTWRLNYTQSLKRNRQVPKK